MQTETNHRVLWQLRPHNIAPVDVFALDDRYELVVDVPGLTEEQLDLQVERGMLSVGTAGEEKRNVLRAFRLPEDVDVDGIRADLDAGVLTLSLPKSDGARTRRIQVGVA